MKLNDFLNKLKTTPENIAFADTIELIDYFYDFTPTSFKNAALVNDAGKNNGSCKLFAFAQLQQLSAQETLHCFGDYYRNDVLLNPLGSDHQNIRNFMVTGWTGIEYANNPLTAKNI